MTTRPGKIPQLAASVHLALDPLPEYQAALKEDPAGTNELIADYATLLSTLSEAAEARGIIPTITRAIFTRAVQEPYMAGTTFLQMIIALEGPA